MLRRFLFGLVVLALLVGGAAVVGGFAYQAGVAQGLAQSGQWAEGVAPYAYGPRSLFFHPFGFAPLGCLGLFFPLLILFFLFGLARRVFFGGPFRHYRGMWGRHPHGGVPPMFEEWHRQMHGEPAAPTESTPKA